MLVSSLSTNNRSQHITWAKVPILSKKPDSSTQIQEIFVTLYFIQNCKTQIKQDPRILISSGRIFFWFSQQSLQRIYSCPQLTKDQALSCWISQFSRIEILWDWCCRVSGRNMWCRASYRFLWRCRLSYSKILVWGWKIGAAFFEAIFWRVGFTGSWTWVIQGFVANLVA